MESDWADELEKARRGLDPLEFLCGRWRGEGSAHGEPQVATLEGRRILEGTVIEVVEREGTAEGGYEDRCFYRFELGEGRLRVLHLYPGKTEDHPVELTEDGCVWVTGPLDPTVEWRREGAGLAMEVFFPGRKKAQVTMGYGPADTPTTDTPTDTPATDTPATDTPGPDGR